MRGGERAQGVGREVAEKARIPVHVLHATVCVLARGGQPQIALHGVVPCLGQVGHREGAVQQLAFQLEAQDDVERVGDLVRVHADVAACHPGDVAVQVVSRPGGVGFAAAEVPADHWRQKADEFAAAADLQLHQQRLAFVHGRTQ